MPKAPAIGIDLGTTYSCVAYFREDHVQIVHNEIGLNTTPSYVAFTSDECLIGDIAKSQGVMYPESTIFDVKRLIGRKFDDETVQEDIKSWPFPVINVAGEPHIRVKHKGEITSFSPFRISSMVLTKMKQIAETHLMQTVTDAVITVPAYFNDAQRRATREAAVVAGLNVLRILNEPTAAGIAYALKEKTSKVQNILVYDLGGGTLDVTIMKIKEGKFDVVTTAGDTHLGGGDFDTCMVNHFKAEFLREHGINLDMYPKSIRRLRVACERAKRMLSQAPKATIEGESLYEGIDFVKEISRGLFETLCNDLFVKTLLSVDEALQAAKMKKTQIDEVVLVGGSTRIPKIQFLLSEYFLGKKLNQRLHPDEAVAYGAAIEAAILSGDKSKKLRNMAVTDVTTFTLGLECEFSAFAPVIKRNTPIPVKISRGFYNAKEEEYSSFLVYEGEHKIATKNRLLGNFNFSHRKAPRHKVTFEIDRNGILTVSVVEAGTTNTKHITITDSTGYLSKEELTRHIREAQQMTSDAEFHRVLSEARSALEGLQSLKQK